MIRLTYLPILTLLLVASLVVAACGEAGGAAGAGEGAGGDDEMPEVVRFGLIPAENAEEQLLQWRPVKEYLEQALGVEVEFFVGTDYTATIEAMRAGRVDAAAFGPFSYVLAHDQGVAELLVGPKNPETGEDMVYYSVAITHVDSGIYSLDDVIGKDFAFVDPASTSGHLIPKAGMRAAGYDPDRDFNTFFAGGHDVVALAVYNRTLPAGVVFGGSDPDNPLHGGIVTRLAERGQVEEEAFRVIWVSDPIPSGPIAVRPDAPQVLKDALKEAFLAINPEDHPEVYEALGQPYGETSDAIYDVLRRTADELGLDLEEVGG